MHNCTRTYILPLEVEGRHQVLLSRVRDHGAHLAFISGSVRGHGAYLAFLYLAVCEAMALVASAGYRLLFLTARPLTRSQVRHTFAPLYAFSRSCAELSLPPSPAMLTSFSCYACPRPIFC